MSPKRVVTDFYDISIFNDGHIHDNLVHTDYIVVRPSSLRQTTDETLKAEVLSLQQEVDRLRKQNTKLVNALTSIQVRCNFSNYDYTNIAPLLGIRDICQSALSGGGE